MSRTLRSKLCQYLIAEGNSCNIRIFWFTGLKTRCKKIRAITYQSEYSILSCVQSIVQDLNRAADYFAGINLNVSRSISDSRPIKLQTTWRE
ncbi:hypothetical protein AQUCO_03100096v1 [Aquilegia coerulea]|uniref:Uncharacterized protein n=1 Tax=Aquilegia coerulea TaxID=218851 RepID=A0A2G5D0R6_AQUCA|nr:hypothetical protein AQUCO_03100096v1 [Aquilegia coerulea]